MARDRAVRGCRIWLTAVAARQPTTVDTTLDVADVRLSARKGELVVRAGKGRDGGKRCILPVHPTLQN